MNELVSVVIPAYNVEKYIGKCIECVCRQSYKNIEIIIVNDGSKDNTQLVCEKLAVTDSRITVITQKNSGGSAARNRGMMEAKGKYLCFVDADDVINEAFVQNMVDNYVSHQAELSICGFEEKKEDTIINATSGNLQIMTQEEAMEKLLREDSFKGYVWNKLFNMEIIRQNKLQFDTTIKIWEDVLFVFEYLIFCQKVVYDPTPMYSYMYIQNSISHSDNHLVGIETAYTAIKAKDIIAELIPQGYDRIKKQLSVRYVQSSLAVIRNIGYAKSNEYKEYYHNCIKIIKIHKKTAYQSLSAKDKILTNICIVCPKFLMILYRLVS